MQPAAPIHHQLPIALVINVVDVVVEHGVEHDLDGLDEQEDGVLEGVCADRDIDVVLEVLADQFVELVLLAVHLEYVGYLG